MVMGPERVQVAAMSDGYSDNVTESPTRPASRDIDASRCATSVHPVGLELNIL